MFEGIKNIFLTNKLNNERLQIELALMKQVKEASVYQRSRKALEDSDETEWMNLDISNEGDLNEVEVLELQEMTLKLYYKNPHARNIIRLFEKYVTGRGFSVLPETDIPQIREWWDEFWRINKMEKRKKEIVRRSMRDGEHFQRRFLDANGMVMIRFLNPRLIRDPKHKKHTGKGNLSHGILTNPDDIEDVIGYYYNGEFIKSDVVYHDKILVDSDVKRGRPFLEPMVKHLNQYRKWLNDRIKLNTVRAAVGIVKKITGTPTQAANIKSDQETSKLKAPDGTAYQKLPEAVSLFTVNRGVDYDFKTPNLQASDVQHDGRTLLLTISAGSGLPEFMVTCFDEETEILTNKGFIKINDYNNENIASYSIYDDVISFDKPLAKHVYEYNGEMIQFKNQHCDLLVTPNHKMLNKTRRDRKYKFNYAANITNGYRYFKTSTGGRINNFGFENDLGIDKILFAELLGWYISEGCIYNRKNRNEVEVLITQKKDINKVNRIGALLKQIYGKEVNYNKGSYHIYDRKLAKWLEDNCGTKSVNKKIPFWNQMSNEELEVLLDALWQGDGHKVHNCNIYTTVSKELASDVQAIAYMLGYSAKIKKERPHKSNVLPIYRVFYHSQEETRLFPWNIKKKKYKGIVWCFTTKDGTVIVRRNGKISVQGNSDASNSNMASTLIAEAPGVMEFEDWQDHFKVVFKDLFATVIKAGQKANKIPMEIMIEKEVEKIDKITGEIIMTTEMIKEPVSTDCQINFPEIVHRDLLKETQALTIQNQNRWASDHTCQSRLDLDPEFENEQIKKEQKEIDDINQDDLDQTARARDNLIKKVDSEKEKEKDKQAGQEVPEKVEK